MSWMPLSEAHAHVLRAEGHPKLTARDLLKALADERVHARAGRLLAPMSRPDLRERMDEPLLGDFWMYDLDPAWRADVSWSESSAVLPQGHPLAPAEAFRIEVDRDELLAIWPSAPETVKALSAGRPPIYDAGAILAEAGAWIYAHGVPVHEFELIRGVTEILGEDRVPRSTRMKEIIGPYHKRQREAQGYGD